MIVKPGKKSTPWQDRFWDKVAKTGEDECWQWLAAKTPKGYGKLGTDSGFKYSHRLAYELEFGPIPYGLDICHRCDVPSCCNPRHLFAGTRSDNMQDACQKRRISHGSRSNWARHSDEVIAEVRRRLDTDESQGSISRLTGVPQSTISQLHRGKIRRLELP